MNNKYPFSPGTPEAKALQNLSGKERVSVLQATHIYQDAVDELMNCKHPRAKAFHEWLSLDQKNQKWFEANKQNFRLVEGGIEILGDVFCLEDETVEANGVDVWNYETSTFFSFDGALRHAKEQGRRLPTTWTKYIDFLPGDNQNKVRFLLDVLGLKMDAYHYCLTSEQGELGRYWSASPYSTNAFHLEFNSKSINPSETNDRAYMFQVRCLKD